MLTDARYVFVLEMAHIWHPTSAVGFTKENPLKAVKLPRYWPQFIPGGGSTETSSRGLQTTFLFATPTDSIPATRYVNGETLYMKIQKPGSDVGVARTPQKTRQSEKRRLATFPPVSASSIPAMIMCA